MFSNPQAAVHISHVTSEQGEEANAGSETRLAIIVTEIPAQRPPRLNAHFLPKLPTPTLPPTLNYITTI
jgi:hypothetical protein